jgi:predicted NBD/HSP70 family sugar kinase
MADRGTPAWLRTQNDRNALRLLLNHGPLSRTQLGELSGLSKPTAGAMLQRLEQAGLVAPVGAITDARGPNATTYGVRSDALVGVAVSVLDDRLEAVAVDATDAVHPMAEVFTASLHRAPVDDVEAAVRAACSAAGLAEDTVRVVAVGVQAAINAEADELAFTDTLPGWPATGAARIIADGTGRDVILDNDVNLATIAERGASGENDFVYLWLGTGLGAGIDIAGRVQRGTSGSAGEIGYLEVPRSAASLDPEAHDFTDLLGGPAIARLLGAPTLAEALRLLPGNEPALEAIAARVALLSAVLEAVLDPGRLVLGGPTGLAGGDRLAELVAERLGADRVRVRTGRSSERPVLQGARALLVSRLRQRLEARIEEDA